MPTLKNVSTRSFKPVVDRDQIAVARSAIVMTRLRTQTTIHAAVEHKLDLSAEIFFHSPTHLLHFTTRLDSTGTLRFPGRIVSFIIGSVSIHHLTFFMTAAAGRRPDFAFIGLNHVSMAKGTAAVKSFP